MDSPLDRYALSRRLTEREAPLSFVNYVRSPNEPVDPDTY